MNIMELKKEIDSNNLNGIYILTGDEYTIIAEYVKMMKNHFDGDFQNVDEYVIVSKNLCGSNLFGSDRKFYYINDDKSFLTAEKVWDNFEKKVKEKKCLVVFKYGKLDQRSKFYKRFENRIIVFDKLSDNILSKYIHKKVDLNQDNTNTLIDICQGDYGRILLEIDKIENVCEKFNLSADNAFKLCMNANIFHIDVDGEVYDLIDRVMMRDYKNAFALLEDSKRRDDNQLLILALLHNNVRCLLQLLTAGNQGDTSKVTGMTPYQIKIASRYVTRYSCEELVRFMKYIKYCDNSIKQGIMMPEIVMDYLLINIL